MKKAIYLIIALIGLSAPSCSDSMLDFSPTDSGSGKELLKSASTAITSVNGVYRSMWTAGWSTTANTHQCAAATTQYFHATIGRPENHALMAIQTINAKLIWRKNWLKSACSSNLGVCTKITTKPRHKKPSASYLNK